MDAVNNGAVGGGSPVSGGDNCFATLGLPVRWALDETDLTTRYLKLQRTVHPDRAAGGSAQRRRLAEQHAAAANDAYRTLRSPLRRARHLLALRGAAPNPSATVHGDDAALLQQMAWRERMDAAGDDTEPLQALMHEASVARQHGEATFGAAWEHEDMPSAAAQFIHLQFIGKLIDELTLRLSKD